MTKEELFTKLKDNWKPAIAVTLINIPLSLALAVASLGPDSSNAPLIWLLTAIYAGFFAAIFASSKHNIYGPAWALSWILLSFVLAWTGNIFLIPIVTIVTWILIVLVSVFKITKYITLIPSSALHWFLIWVWIIIALSQANSALWIIPNETHSYLYENVIQTFSQLNNINIATFLLFLGSFIFLQITKKYIKFIPWAVPLTIIWIIIWYFIYNTKDASTLYDIAILKTKFSGLEFHFADFSYLTWHSDGIIFSEIKTYLWDIIHLENLQLIFRLALVIAVIAILETIIAAKIAQKITKVPFNKDKEVMGLWIANITCGIAWGMPATAVLVRTAFNTKSGATSKMSAFLVAIFTLAISLALFNVFTFLPMPIIAAILMNIALGLIDLKVMRELKYLDKVSFVTAIIVAVITVAEDPIVWLIVWTIIAFILFVRHVSIWKINVTIFRDLLFYNKITLRKYLAKQSINDSIIIKFPTTINYLNAEAFFEQISKLTQPKHLIFNFGQVMIIDIDGIEVINELIQTKINNGHKVYITGVVGDEMIEVFNKNDTVYKQIKEKWRVYKSSAFVLDHLKIKCKNEN